MEKHLQAVNLSCIRQQKIIFTDFSFGLTAGEVLLVEGANGSGKSSLLRLLAGLSTPANGDIFWQQQAIHTVFSTYTSHLHYVGHANGIKLGLTVAENLQLTRHLHHYHSCKDYAAILTALQLHAHQHCQANYLSAGQKRRLSLAKLFLYPKKLWLLDEPLTALDTQTQAYFIAQLERHIHNGGMAVISSHHALACPVTQTLRLAPC